MLELNLFGVPSKDNLALISFVNGDFDDIEMTSTFQVNSDVLRSSTEIKVAGSTVHDSSISITRRISQNQYSIIINTEYNSKNINSEMNFIW
jgi:hypothetical protein